MVVGHGHEVVGVRMAETEQVLDEDPHRLVHHAQLESDPPRSTNSSLTTLSHSSLAPSTDLHVTTTSPYEPIDIGDEGDYGDLGQQDRGDGRVDEVFKLHSSRRMKPTSTRRGVSIPSRESHAQPALADPQNDVGVGTSICSTPTEPRRPISPRERRG